MGGGGFSVGVGDGCGSVGVGTRVAAADAVRVQLGWVGVPVTLVGVNDGGAMVFATVSVGFKPSSRFCSWEVKAQPRKVRDKTARTKMVRLLNLCINSSNDQECDDGMVTHLIVAVNRLLDLFRARC